MNYQESFDQLVATCNELGSEGYDYRLQEVVALLNSQGFDVELNPNETIRIGDAVFEMNGSRWLNMGNQFSHWKQWFPMAV